MAASRPSVARAGTMQTTAEEGVEYLFRPKADGEQQIYRWFDDPSRRFLQSKGLKIPYDDNGIIDTSDAPEGETKTKGASGKSKVGKSKTGKSAVKRNSSIGLTLAEAKNVLGDKGIDLSGSRKTRSAGKQKLAKPSVKRAGTMQKTAKEGKSYLKRAKRRKEKGRK